MVLNRVDEAEQAISEARKRGLNGEYLLQIRYWLAFLPRCKELSQRPRSRVAPIRCCVYGSEHTGAYHSHIRKSRDLTDKAVGLAQRAGDREVAAEYLGEATLREAEVGESAYTRRRAQQALALAPDRDIQTLAALTFARTRCAPCPDSE